MESFTSDQLLVLAGYWRLAAQTLNAYQTAHWNKLSIEQHIDANGYQNSLLDRANSLETGQIQAIIHDVRPAYETVLAVADYAIRALAESRHPAVGLNIGAMLVVLAAAVARGHLKSIELARHELYQLQTME